MELLYCWHPGLVSVSITTFTPIFPPDRFYLYGKVSSYDDWQEKSNQTSAIKICWKTETNLLNIASYFKGVFHEWLVPHPHLRYNYIKTVLWVLTFFNNYCAGSKSVNQLYRVMVFDGPLTGLSSLTLQNRKSIIIYMAFWWINDSRFVLSPSQVILKNRMAIVSIIAT